MNCADSFTRKHYSINLILYCKTSHIILTLAKISQLLSNQFIVMHSFTIDSLILLSIIALVWVNNFVMVYPWIVPDGPWLASIDFSCDLENLTLLYKKHNTNILIIIFCAVIRHTFN